MGSPQYLVSPLVFLQPRPCLIYPISHHFVKCFKTVSLLKKQKTL
uniref:Uncharacterized protein n=1 Tax=Anguilla anguilla TaxID=7936 RepID=A0A0E9P742_ANGAN